MGRVMVRQCDFSSGGDGQQLGEVYNTSAPTNPCQLYGSGFDGTTGSAYNADVFTTVASSEVLRGTLHPRDHYAKVTVADAGQNYSPGVLARCDTSFFTAYMVDPGPAFGLFRQLGLMAAGTYFLLGTGGSSSISIGDTIEIECQGTTIRGGKNGVSEISVTDGTVTSGQGCGVFSFVNLSAAVGDDFEAGNLSANAQAWQTRRNQWMGHRSRTAEARRRERLMQIRAGSG